MIGIWTFRCLNCGAYMVGDESKYDHYFRCVLYLETAIKLRNAEKAVDAAFEKRDW